MKAWITRMIAVALFSLPFTVHALELSEAKEQGLVGEQVDGYLGAVVGSAEVGALVSEINNRRKAHYQRIAEQNQISLDQVAKLAGKKAIEKTESGDYINLGSGWQKK